MNFDKLLIVFHLKLLELLISLYFEHFLGHLLISFSFILPSFSFLKVAHFCFIQCFNKFDLAVVRRCSLLVLLVLCESLKSLFHFFIIPRWQTNHQVFFVLRLVLCQVIRPLLLCLVSLLMHECIVLGALKLIDLLSIVNDSLLVVLYLLHHGWPRLEQFIHVSFIRSLLLLDVLTLLHGHLHFAIQDLLF